MKIIKNILHSYVSLTSYPTKTRRANPNMKTAMMQTAAVVVNSGDKFLSIGSSLNLALSFPMSS